MVDIDTHRVVDLLASREVEDVAEWLRSYPNIRIVSRDGSVSYKSAIEQAGMDIQQVSDRFHLLKGLTDAAKKFISRLLSATYTLPTEASPYAGKLTGDYCGKSPLAALVHLREERELALYSTEPRALIFSTALLAPKSTRTTQGVQVMTLKPKYRLSEVKPVEEAAITNVARYRCRSIPAAGAVLKEEDGEQMRLL